MSDPESYTRPYTNERDIINDHLTLFDKHLEEDDPESDDFKEIGLDIADCMLRSLEDFRNE